MKSCLIDLSHQTIVQPCIRWHVTKLRFLYYVLGPIAVLSTKMSFTETLQARWKTIYNFLFIFPKWIASAIRPNYPTNQIFYLEFSDDTTLSAASPLFVSCGCCTCAVRGGSEPELSSVKSGESFVKLDGVEWNGDGISNLCYLQDSRPFCRFFHTCKRIERPKDCSCFWSLSRK